MSKKKSLEMLVYSLFVLAALFGFLFSSTSYKDYSFYLIATGIFLFIIWIAMRYVD